MTYISGRKWDVLCYDTVAREVQYILVETSETKVAEFAVALLVLCFFLFL